MIHQVLVGPETEIAELKKLVRKRLMTGGAVVRLQQGLSEAELRVILDRFADGVTPHGIQAAVLGELAGEANLTAELKSRLRSLNLKEVERRLGRNELIEI